MPRRSSQRGGQSASAGTAILDPGPKPMATMTAPEPMAPPERRRAPPTATVAGGGRKRKTVRRKRGSRRH